MGLVEEDKLAELYRHRLMVPRVTRAQLEAIPRPVLDRLTREMAAEFRSVPVEVDGEGNLTIAMSDPANTHAVDEVAFFTSLQVVRVVATESDIEWALGKYYGVAPPSESARPPGRRDP